MDLESEDSRFLICQIVTRLIHTSLRKALFGPEQEVVCKSIDNLNILWNREKCYFIFSCLNFVGLSMVEDFFFLTSGKQPISL